jgi:tight adherence protein C
MFGVNGWILIATACSVLAVIGIRIGGAQAAMRSRQSRLIRRIGGTWELTAFVDDLELPFFQRLVVPLWRSIGQTVANRLVPANSQRELAQKLQVAGFKMNAAAFTSLRLVMTGVLVLVGIAADATGAIPRQYEILVPVGTAIIGYLFLGVRLRSQYQRGQNEVEAALPEAFDLISVSMEAGQSFESALRRTVPRLPGLAGQQFARVVQDLEVGLTRVEALRELADRTQIEELKRFHALVAQAERTGAGMSVVLKAQADRVKQQRVAKAREQAAMVPVKILFPLALFIFPSIFVAILGGGVITMIQAFSHGGL